MEPKSKFNLKNTFTHKKIMITGGLGFIGSNLAQRLVKLNAKILIIDSLVPDHGGNIFNIKDIRRKVKVNISDMRDKHSMTYLVRKCDYIFNLAGQVSHIDSMENPQKDLEINCASQLSLLEACRKYNPGVKIIFASTRQIYGHPDYLPVDEKHILRPADINGINKMAGEWYHILYNKIYGLPTTALRLTNTYGPRQLIRHNRQGFIGWFIHQILTNGEINIFGDGMQRRDLNYVDDVVEAFLKAAASPKTNGEIFNLGHPKPITLKNIAKLMIKIYGRGNYKLTPFPPEKKKIDIGDCYCSFQKIKKALDWQPRISLKEGLRKTFNYYRRYQKYYLS
ncbi:MAG: NAD-dependent epimerase/dehydratase family protein [Candidatus Doudnabacteria bacterium]